MESRTSRPTMIKSSRPYFPEEMRRKIAAETDRILSSGILTMGPWVKKFESRFAEICGVERAIATNSGTSALEILLRFYEVENKEVIVPTNTFLATANAVIFAGGKPVLTDISRESLCIDLKAIKEKVTPLTRAVIAVHIAGLICPDIDEIRKFCRDNNLILIEDAAHAAGASANSHMAGSLGDGGAFSFFPTKPLTTGEGGMITTNDPDCADFARSLRCHGIATGSENTGSQKNLLLRLGYNWRMSELQAMIGWYQLEILNEMIDNRLRVAKLYDEGFRDYEHLSLVCPPENFRHSYYKYPVMLEVHINREMVIGLMREKYNIQCGSIYYPPCHLQPFYQKKYQYKTGDFPIAEDILSRTIALPVFPDLNNEHAGYVIDSLKAVIESTWQKS